MKKEKTVTINYKFSKENIKRFWINGKWAIKELINMSPFETILNFILLIILAVFPIINSFLYAKQLDIIVDLYNTQNYQSIFNINHPFIQVILIIAILSFVKAVLKIVQRYLYFRSRELHFKKFEDNLYYKIANLDLAQFEDSKIANTILKAQDNIWKLKEFSDIFNNILSQLIKVIVAGVFVFSNAPLIGFILIITSIPNTIIWSKYVNAWWRFYDDKMEAIKKRKSMKNFIIQENSVNENKIISAESKIYKRITNLTNLLFKEHNNIKVKHIKDDIFTKIFNFILDLLIPLYLIKDLILGNKTIGDFSFIIERCYQFNNEIGNISINIVDLFDAATGIEKIRELTELKTVIPNGRVKINIKTPPAIEFKNVSFKYPNTDKYILKDINIKINPYEEIAIVGQNGAGKTTFLKLLLRFYTVTKGEILIDNININDLDISTYYKRIGALFQDYNIMGFESIKENIKITKTKDMKNLDYATSLKYADFTDVVKNLPLHDKQLLSKSFENGINLSTGQMQKLALSKMFYRNAPILILDEPTASIDAVAEYNIFKRIYKFMTDKTVIIISHRFSTVKNAQRIIVFSKGKIVEEGTHKELLKLNGRYAKAYKLQAKGYENKV